MGYCRTCKRDVPPLSRVDAPKEGMKSYHCPGCFQHTSVSLFQPKAPCSKCIPQSASSHPSSLKPESQRRPTKPPRYREVVPVEPKVRLNLVPDVNYYDDLDDLMIGASEDEEPVRTESGACRVRMALEDYRSHELRQSRGEVSRISDHFEVHCSYEDLDDMIKIATELISHEPEVSSATLRIGRLVLGLHLKSHTKSSLSQMLSHSIAKEKKQSNWENLKTAASNSGNLAVSSEDLSLVLPMLDEIETLKEMLQSQLDEAKAITNSFKRKLKNLDNTRKIEDSIDLTRRYEMSACTTPRSSNRVEDEDVGTNKKEFLEKELEGLQEKLKEAGTDTRVTAKISTRISRIKTELSSIKSAAILNKNKANASRRITSGNSSFTKDSQLKRPSSVTSRRSSTDFNFNLDELSQSIANKHLELDDFDEMNSSSIALSSDVMKEQLTLRRERQDLEEQRMKMEIEAESSKRKIQLQEDSLALQKAQLEAERNQLQQDRIQQLQLSRENLRRRSQLQSLIQSFLVRVEESRQGPQQELMLQDIREQLLS